MPCDFHVALLEPEIPQNTGSIGRLCLAVGATLHLIEPLGFEIDSSRLKRAGLDYWEHLKVKVHPNIDAFLKSFPKETPIIFIETKAGHTLYEHRFQPGTVLVFGKETTGIPDYLVERYPDRVLRIPQFDARVRSLNLSNAVSIAVYEAVRQNLPSHGATL